MLIMHGYCILEITEPFEQSMSSQGNLVLRVK